MAHLRGRAAWGRGRERDLGKGDLGLWQGVKGGALNISSAGLLLSRYVEHWPHCLSDLLKTSVQFRPVHNQGDGVHRLFCKKFLVQRQNCLRELLKAKRQGTLVLFK